MAFISNEIYESTVVLPITEEARAVAHQLASGQPTPQKAEQVQLNTLAVSVVNNYLRMMDIPTDITASYSRKPFLLMLNNVADLMVTGVGRLECRPVKARAQNCHVPAEVWGDRIGYIAVQMDDALEEAALLGFTPTVESEELPLREFQPLQNFLQHINQLTIPSVEESLPLNISQQFTNLSQWLRNTFETGWQTVQSLLAQPQVEFAFRVRTSGSELINDTDAPLTTVTRAKRIDLGTPVQASVILIVEIEQEEVGQKTYIRVQIISPDAQIHLPQDLQLKVLDEFGEAFLEAQTSNQDDYLELQFSGNAEEKFNVTVALSNITVVEEFVI